MDDSRKHDPVAKSLANAEAAASSETGAGVDDGIADAQERESGARGFYRGEGVNDRVGRAVGAAMDIKKGNFKGAFKKAGPIVTIFLVIFLVGAGLGATQLFQPFSLIAQFQESFNSMHPSAYNRSATLLRYQMTNGSRVSPIKGSIFSKPKFVLSSKQIAENEKNGITYNDQFELEDGRKIRVLEYETDGGQKRIVTVDKETADLINKSGRGKAASFNAMLNDTSFRQRFAAASQGWRGQFANWFGTRTGDFLSENKLTRNLFKDWEKTKAEAQAEGRTALDAVKDTMKKKITESVGGGVSRRDAAKDDDGNTKTDDNGDRVPGGTSSVDSGGKVNSAQVKTKLDNIKGTISGGVNIGCAVADFVGVVSLMVAAAEAQQILTVVGSYMETVDKTKAGYGDEAPINELANTLNDKVKQDHETIVHDNKGEKMSDDGKDGVIYATTETAEGKTKSAMQSAGMAALFGNGLTNPNDASVQSFNLTSSANTILGGLGMSAGSFMTCTAARAAAGATMAVTDLVACLTGVGCIATLFKGFAFSAAIGLAIAGVIAVLTPWVTSVFERDLITELAGEDLGNALVSGANMQYGYVHKANGGSLATREKYEQFAIEKQKVLAEEAKLERETLSPFDVTSKNTFMGTLMTQLMTFNTSNSLMSAVSTGGSVMTSSLMAMTPRVSAVAEQIAESLPSESDYEATCPYLASIGAIGDSFCNPYMVTDYDTIEDDPAAVVNAISDQFEDEETSDGNVVIDQDSDLMKYITYCGDRVSSFGVADQSYASDFRIETGNSIADTVIGAAPVVGDLIDVLQAGPMLDNIGYITGESCVAGNNVSGVAPDWDTAKYYQRFIEDQSLMESMGIIEESAVTVALREYYEQNPLDESYEGQLARWSGLSKETVSDVLDVIAYYNYINAYDASERYAFGAPVVDAGEQPLLFDDEQTMDGAPVALEGVVYRDLRNRSFAV